MFLLGLVSGTCPVKYKIHEEKSAHSSEFWIRITKLIIYTMFYNCANSFLNIIRKLLKTIKIIYQDNIL